MPWLHAACCVYASSYKVVFQGMFLIEVDTDLFVYVE